METGSVCASKQLRFVAITETFNGNLLDIPERLDGSVFRFILVPYLDDFRLMYT